MSLGLVDALVLGVVEGLTEFLPVSSTGHLTIAEGLLGLKVDDPAVTAFTAVIQTGAILAAILYFGKDIVRFIRGFFGGLTSTERRRSEDWRFSLVVLLGSIPIGVTGLLFKGVIKGPVLRSLVAVAIGLIAWSAVMVVSERRPRQDRGEGDVRLLDALTIGIAQCAALVPGVSRSGATISVGLLRGLDRVTATRLSFFLGIPALTAAGGLELKDALGAGVGPVPTVVGTAVSFVVSYATIAFLLRFVVRHSIATFVPYRVALGVIVLGVVAVG